MSLRTERCDIVVVGGGSAAFEAAVAAREAGIRWEPLKEHAKVGGKRYFERGIAIHVAGGGIGQLTQWRRLAEDLGVEIRFESPVCAVQGDLRRVEGVTVSSPDGRYDLM